jgi:hypothetical protein
MWYKKTSTEEIIEPSHIKKATRKTRVKHFNQISAKDKNEKKPIKKLSIKSERKLIIK